MTDRSRDFRRSSGAIQPYLPDACRLMSFVLSILSALVDSYFSLPRHPNDSSLIMRFRYNYFWTNVLDAQEPKKPPPGQGAVVAHLLTCLCSASIKTFILVFLLNQPGKPYFYWTPLFETFADGMYGGICREFCRDENDAGPAKFGQPPTPLGVPKRFLGVVKRGFCPLAATNII